MRDGAAPGVAHDPQSTPYPATSQAPCIPGTLLRRSATLVAGILLTALLLALLDKLLRQYAAPAGANAGPLRVEFHAYPAPADTQDTHRETVAAAADPQTARAPLPGPPVPIQASAPAEPAPHTRAATPVAGLAPAAAAVAAPAPATPTVATSTATEPRQVVRREPGATPEIRGGANGVDRDYALLRSAVPEYPRRASRRGIEGHVILEFTVTASGHADDIRVIEAHPRGMFDAAAIAAAREFRFAPGISAGEPVATAGVRNRFSFRLRP